MNKLITLITVNYNNNCGLAQTIMSVLAQKYTDYEYVIIDGGSIDDSVSTITQNLDKFKEIKYISEKDKGIYNAMNKGVNIATGKYCLFLNSGDCLFDEYSLSNSIPYLTKGIDIISGIAIGKGYKMVPPDSKNLSTAFFLKKSLNHQSTFIKRDLLLKYSYNENLLIAGDVDFFYKVLIIHDATYENIPVSVCICESAGASGNLELSLKERYQCIKKMLPTRMSYDIDFIVNFHNPVIMKINDIIYTHWLRNIYFYIKKWIG